MSEPAATHREAGRRLRRVLLGIAAQARGDLERIRRCPSGGIHALRRRMKKLQSVLRLVRDHVPAREKNAIRRRVRFLKNAFAGQRDDEVMSKLARDIGGRALAGRVQRRPHAIRVMPGAKHAAAAAALEKLVAGLRLDSLTWDEVISSYDRAFRKERKAWSAACDDPAPELFHEWRKQIKTHYFQTLVMRQAAGKMRGRLQQSRRLGHWLGLLHDLDVLTQAIRRDPGWSDAQWPSKIGRQQAKIRERVARAGRKFHQKTGSHVKRRLMKRITAVGEA